MQLLLPVTATPGGVIRSYTIFALMQPVSDDFEMLQVRSPNRGQKAMDVMGSFVLHGGAGACML